MQTRTEAVAKFMREMKAESFGTRVCDPLRVDRIKTNENLARRSENPNWCGSQTRAPESGGHFMPHDSRHFSGTLNMLISILTHRIKRAGWVGLIPGGRPVGVGNEFATLHPAQSAVADAVGGRGQCHQRASGVSLPATGPPRLAQFERAVGLRHHADLVRGPTNFPAQILGAVSGGVGIVGVMQRLRRPTRSGIGGRWRFRRRGAGGGAAAFWRGGLAGAGLGERAGGGATSRGYDRFSFDITDQLRWNGG